MRPGRARRRFGRRRACRPWPGPLSPDRRTTRCSGHRFGPLPEWSGRTLRRRPDSRAAVAPASGRICNARKWVMSRAAQIADPGAKAHHDERERDGGSMATSRRAEVSSRARRRDADRHGPAHVDRGRARLPRVRGYVRCSCAGRSRRARGRCSWCSLSLLLLAIRRGCGDASTRCRIRPATLRSEDWSAR